MTKLLVNNIKLSLNDDEVIAISKAKKVLKKEHINEKDFSFSIYKKSIDARDKNNILLVYTVILFWLKASMKSTLLILPI